MKMELERVSVYPKDVQRITGKSKPYGRMLLKKIKVNLSKEEHQFVSVEEFSQYTGLKVELIRSYICN